MITAKSMSIALGAQVLVGCGDLLVKCIVVDVKAAYGKHRLQVRPVAGEGTQWVELSRVRVQMANGGEMALESLRS